MGTYNDRLTQLIDKKGISAYYLSKATGVSQATISRLKSDATARASISTNERIARYFKVSAEWLLTGEGDKRDNHTDKSTQQSNGLPLIPIDAVAGFPTADNDGAALADCQRYVVPEFNAKGANFLIRVSGDSMMPMFHNGDIIACRKISDVLFFQWGEVYVLDTSQGVLVKRVRECQADEACITCESENERYDSFRLPKSDIRSLSTIVGLIRMM